MRHLLVGLAIVGCAHEYGTYTWLQLVERNVYDVAQLALFQNTLVIWDGWLISEPVENFRYFTAIKITSTVIGGSNVLTVRLSMRSGVGFQRAVATGHVQRCTNVLPDGLKYLYAENA